MWHSHFGLMANPEKPKCFLTHRDVHVVHRHALQYHVEGDVEDLISDI
jgi:hypothetical protein